MFGKPEWFKKKPSGWGIKPVSRQGWIYSMSWLVVLVLPFLVLVSEWLVVESIVWLLAAAGALAWDVRQILRAMGDTIEDVLYIDETETLSERFAAGKLATGRFDFRLRG